MQGCGNSLWPGAGGHHQIEEGVPGPHAVTQSVVKSESLQEEGAGPAAAAPCCPCPMWGTPADLALRRLLLAWSCRGGLPLGPAAGALGHGPRSSPRGVLLRWWEVAEAHLPYCFHHAALEHHFADS